MDSKLPKYTDERRLGWGEGKNGNKSGMEGGKFPLGMGGKWGDILVGNKRGRRKKGWEGGKVEKKKWSQHKKVFGKKWTRANLCLSRFS